MIYLDTSALIKRYLPERNSDRFDAWFAEHAPASVSRLTFVEARSTLARKRRDKTIRASRESAAMDEIRTDLQDGVLWIQPCGDEHFVEAFHLMEQLRNVPLRTLDALHLAVARLGEFSGLATADIIMRRAAEELGLEVAFFGE
ncbi:MAG: type II toxin-antitoxin system VapC family toxin [Candidatus Methylophosphatis roskildensis]